MTRLLAIIFITSFLSACGGSFIGAVEHDFNRAGDFLKNDAKDEPVAQYPER